MTSIKFGNRVSEKIMYLSYDEQTITDFGKENIEAMYARGYVFTRKGKGVMQHTRSVRIDLSKFELSSENRRILRQIQDLTLNIKHLPFADYDWQVGKLAKDFYDKFGDKTFSANKIKELLTDPNKSNFNTLLVYSLSGPSAKLGYCIAYASKNILHYSYPFYSLGGLTPKDMGLGMMIRAIVWAKEKGKEYVYLGSASRPSDTYKLQFTGVEWFTLSEVEGLGIGGWSPDLDKLKQELKNA